MAAAARGDEESVFSCVKGGDVHVIEGDPSKPVEVNTDRSTTLLSWLSRAARNRHAAPSKGVALLEGDATIQHEHAMRRVVEALHPRLRLWGSARAAISVNDAISERGRAGK